MNMSSNNMPSNRGPIGKTDVAPPRQRGVALVTALVVLVGMMLGGIALARSVDTGNLVAGNVAFRQSSLHVADLGVEAAVSRLQTLMNQKKLDVTSDNYSPTYADDVPLPPTANAVTSAATDSTARFLVERLCSPTNCLGDPSRYYRVTVKTQGQRDTESWAQAFLKQVKVPFKPDAAITTGGNLTVSGNAKIKNSGAHSNSDVTVSGSASIDGTVSASGKVTNTSSSILKTESGAATKPIPSINPAEFKQYAEYILAKDGKVLDHTNADALLADVSGGGKWEGWDFSVTGGTVKWQMSANDTTNGRFYIEGDAVVSGNPGTKTAPWSATLIAEGNINISGNPIMVNHTVNHIGDGSTVPEGVKNLLFVAGLDLKINGNLTQDQAFQGIMAAHEQVAISGNPSLGGYIVAEDAGNSSNTATENTVSGSMELVSGAALATPFGSDKPSRLAWRELEK